MRLLLEAEWLRVGSSAVLLINNDSGVRSLVIEEQSCLKKGSTISNYLPILEIVI